MGAVELKADDWVIGLDSIGSTFGTWRVYIQLVHVLRVLCVTNVRIVYAPRVVPAYPPPTTPWSASADTSSSAAPRLACPAPKNNTLRQGPRRKHNNVGGGWKRKCSVEASFRISWSRKANHFSIELLS
jgi:hypothetical protein